MNRISENRKWYIYARKADFNQLAREHGITPVTARIMINRGVRPEEFDDFLYGSAAPVLPDTGDSPDFSGRYRRKEMYPACDTHDDHLMLDMDLAVDIIENSVAEGEKIRIVGDYDIDGVCATTILTKAIRRLGGHVDHDIPDRARDGYGINERIIDKALEDGIDLIVTCDNGISAEAAVSKAAANGIKVVITDHHEVPWELPEADAIVDPKQDGDPYPFKDICGAGIALKLVRILYQNAGIPRGELGELIMFAAIATVGDVMPLIDENRKLVKQGLELIRSTDNIGISSLIDVCQIRRERISAYTIGFVLGPCINAGGRLRSAEIAMRLFDADDAACAGELALQLKILNDERKALTEKFVNEARLQVEKNYAGSNVLVLYLPGCHESVAGIIAGRIREYYYRPAIVLTDTESDAGLVKGSARSIDSYDIYSKLMEASALLEKFGGHRLAAGMSLKKENIDALRLTLNERSGLTGEDLIEKIWIDAAMPFGYATVEQAEELELLEPFGRSNERPVFAQKNVAVLSAGSVPGYTNFVKLRLKDESGCICDGIIFADADETLNALAKRDRIDILYYPKPDNYGGRKGVQIQIKAWK